MFGKPFRDSLGGARPVRRLRQTQEESEERKASQPDRERSERRNRRVAGDGQAQPRARANPVEQAPGEHLAAAVRCAERNDQPSKIGVRPAELPFEMRAEHAERLAIDVVDDG